MTEKVRTGSKSKAKDDALRDDLQSIEIVETNYDDLEDVIPDYDDMKIISEDEMEENINKDNGYVANKKGIKATKIKKKESEKNTEEDEYDEEDEEEVNKKIFSEMIKEVQNMEEDDDKGYFEKRLEGKDSKKFIKNLKKFLQSDRFEKKCNELSKLHKIDRNRVADTFSQKAIATIADCMDTAIEVTYCATMFLVNMLSGVLRAAIGLICSIANKLVGFLSLGYTRILA